MALPAGVVGFRLDPVHLLVADERTLIPWCRSHLPEALKVTVEATGTEAAELAEWHRLHPDCSRVFEQPLKSLLNKHASETGELPEGTAPCGGHPRFYVK